MNDIGITEWTEEQIKGLEAIEAEYPQGFLCLLPIAVDFGTAIRWDMRIYKRGLSGVLKPTVESLKAIGCPNPEEVIEKAERALVLLRSYYPALPAEEKLKVKILELEERRKRLSSGERSEEQVPS